MKLSIDRASFLRALSYAAPVADKRSTLPILSTVLLDIGDDLTVAASDLVSFVVAPAEIVSTDGGKARVCIDADTLTKVVRSFDGERIDATIADRGVVLRCEGAEFKLPLLPGADFPKIPRSEGAGLSSVEAKLLRTMLQRTVFAASVDETRHHLCGVLFRARDGKAVAVATDGHRLSLANGLSYNGTHDRILPRSGVKHIERALDGQDGCAFGFGADGYAHVQTPEVCIAIKCVDATFPPYEQVLPKHETRATVDRDALEAALQRAGLMSGRQASHAVRLGFDGDVLTVEGENVDVGAARETLAIEYAGKPLKIGANAEYLLEAIKCIETDRVIVEVGGELDPLLLRPSEGGDCHVVMPCRI